MKKYLDILLFTLLFFLIFSYFSGKNIEAPLSGIVFETSKTNYTVPAAVDINITNNSSEQISLDTCRDITLRRAGDIVDLPEALCEQTELASRESLTLNLAQYHVLFDTPDTYTFELTLGEQKYTRQINVEYRGSI